MFFYVFLEPFSVWQARSGMASVWRCVQSESENGQHDCRERFDFDQLGSQVATKNVDCHRTAKRVKALESSQIQVLGQRLFFDLHFDLPWIFRNGPSKGLPFMYQHERIDTARMPRILSEHVCHASLKNCVVLERK